MPRKFQPLHRLILQNLTQLLEAAYNEAVNEAADHEKTIKILNQLKSGELTMDRVSITDEGVRVMPASVASVPDRGNQADQPQPQSKPAANSNSKQEVKKEAVSG